MDRFFVPTSALRSRRAQRRSRRAAGHRVAARSVLDGREHDGTVGAEGRSWRRRSEPGADLAAGHEVVYGLAALLRSR